jgi:hypothetical protein
MNTDILLDRTYLEAVYSVLGGTGLAECLIGLVFVLAGWAWFYRQRHTLAQNGILKTLGAILLGTFLSAPLMAAAGCVLPILLVGGIVLSSSILSSRPAIQKIFGPQETIRNGVRLLAVATLFLFTFPMFFWFAKITSPLIQGPQILSTFLSQKTENVAGNRIKLFFDGPVEPIGDLSVLLPAEYDPMFKEGKCYQVTYFYSPIPPVELTETYITQIREGSVCKVE